MAILESKVWTNTTICANWEDSKLQGSHPLTHITTIIIIIIIIIIISISISCFLWRSYPSSLWVDLCGFSLQPG
ncbi:MAG: hypothetical protein N7Q72_05415, partial [Spiroplasma sp. Tabriz.8]|nr:hypothetical protein [Spiroplasma sp. Tabriz.8]